MNRWERFFYGLVAVVLIAFLQGCAVYHAARDGLVR